MRTAACAPPQQPFGGAAVLGRLDAHPGGTPPCLDLRELAFWPRCQPRPGHRDDIPDSDCLLKLLPDYERDRLRGDTDSERYFAVLRKHTVVNLQAGGIQTGITEIAQNTNPISLNALLLTADSLFGVAWHYQPGGLGSETVEGYKTPDFYDMSYRNTPEGFAAASGGWQDEGWTPLSNRSAISWDPGNPDDLFTFGLTDETAANG